MESTLYTYQYAVIAAVVVAVIAFIWARSRSSSKAPPAPAVSPKVVATLPVTPKPEPTTTKFSPDPYFVQTPVVVPPKPDVSTVDKAIEQLTKVAAIAKPDAPDHVQEATKAITAAITASVKPVDKPKEETPYKASTGFNPEAFLSMAQEANRQWQQHLDENDGKMATEKKDSEDKSARG